MNISIVIPLYNCASTIDELFHRIKKSIEAHNFTFEVIFVNDGSTENDWEKVKELSLEYTFVKGISFDGNYGQHNAIACGIEHASGEWIVVMDGDLQDIPENIVRLYQKALEGYDIVYAVRKNRKQGLTNRISSVFFKTIMSFILGARINHTVANFCILRSVFIKNLFTYSDRYTKYLPSLIAYKNIRTSFLEVTHGKRQSGNSSYNFMKRYKLGLDIVFSFAGKRMELFFKIIFTFSILTIFALIFLIFITPVELPALIIFLIIMLILNIVALFLFAVGINNSRALNQNSEHKHYKIDKTVNITIAE